MNVTQLDHRPTIVTRQWGDYQSSHSSWRPARKYRTMLREAKSLLTDKTWIKHELARNHKGRVCNPKGKYATCFCLAGALTRTHIQLLRWCALKAIALGLPPMDEFNDQAKSVKEIHAYIDQLIEACPA